MFRKIRITIYILFLGGFLGILFWFGSGVSINDQKEIFSKLLNISGILFGIMGAWIAIIYSESLNKVFSKDYKTEERKEALKEIDFLLFPMALSATIVVSILLFFVAYPIFRQINFMLKHHLLIRSFSFMGIGFLTILQVWCFIYVFAPAEKLKRKANKEIRQSEIDQRMKSGVQKASKKEL
ncbi:hypothetical protein [Rhodohalobacter mucosus]|uniref:Uncharacterized protein n=1 Tax=Rhodohalobacter mucosus TaxID=2079485 RepID=A0A316TTR9_9BACT|nr:hypothetical protein [Rhodohalobacter mucosus]PWN06709.1 hypothetical protein DDZ15_09345 [Rhodohalobacter mucosus]